MIIVEAQAPGLLREYYAKLHPDWRLLEISLVARKFGGLVAVVSCENTAAPPSSGAMRFSDEVCYVSPKGEVTRFKDIASFANFLIWYERQSILAKRLTPHLFFRCLWLAGLIAAIFGLDAALAGGSPVMVIGAIVALVCFSFLLLFPPRE